MGGRQRDQAIDILKSIAIASVVLIHVTSHGWGVYEINSVDWVANMFWATLARPAVPVFLMCSGALMLPPEVGLTLRKLYMKNLLRVVLAMYFWAIAYKVYHMLTQGGVSVDALARGLKQVLVFNQEFHLYYIHMIILVYACLPVTRIIICI